MSPTLNAFHHILRWRIGQYESADDRDHKGPVHHAPRAESVGEMTAIGAEDRGWDGIGSADNAGGRDIEAIDADEVTRQPKASATKAPKTKK